MDRNVQEPNIHDGSSVWVGYPGSSLRLDLKSLTGNILNLYQQLCYSWVFLTGERTHILQSCFDTSRSKTASHQKCSPMLKKPSTFTEMYLKFEKQLLAFCLYSNCLEKYLVRRPVTSLWSYQKLKNRNYAFAVKTWRTEIMHFHRQVPLAQVHQNIFPFSPFLPFCLSVF